MGLKSETRCTPGSAEGLRNTGENFAGAGAMRGYGIAGAALLHIRTQNPGTSRPLSVSGLGFDEQLGKVPSPRPGRFLIVAYPAVPHGQQWLGKLLERCVLHVEVEPLGVLATAQPKLRSMTICRFRLDFAATMVCHAAVAGS